MKQFQTVTELVEAFRDELNSTLAEHDQWTSEGIEAVYVEKTIRPYMKKLYNIDSHARRILNFGYVLGL